MTHIITVHTSLVAEGRGRSETFKSDDFGPGKENTLEMVGPKWVQWIKSGVEKLL
jgi:hypothetical protein